MEPVHLRNECLFFSGFMGNDWSAEQKKRNREKDIHSLYLQYLGPLPNDESLPWSFCIGCGMPAVNAYMYTSRHLVSFLFGTCLYFDC